MKKVISFAICLLITFFFVALSTPNVGAETKTGNITFGSSNVNINSASVTAKDTLNNTWTITSVGTSTFLQESTCSQVGSNNNALTSLTFTTSLDDYYKITSFSIKVSGSSNKTSGTVDLKVNSTTIGSKTLSGTSEITVNQGDNTSTKGNSLTATYTKTGTKGGIKVYSISYTYETYNIDSVSLNKTSTTIEVGATETLTATISPNEANDKTVTWSSSNESVATVDSNGVVTGIKAGTATITVKTNDQNKTATCLVTVENIKVNNVSLDKTSATIIIGDSLTLIATVSPTGATNKNISWSSSNESVATVDSTGKVTALAIGNAIITVTTEDGGYTANCECEVEEIKTDVSGVDVVPPSVSLEIGDTQQLTATVTPSTAINKKVIWTSSNPDVATVDSDGLVTAKAAGDATITATTEDGGFTDTCVVKVNSAKALVFGTNNKKINAASVSLTDAYDQTWTVTTEGTTSFTANPDYYQIGSKSNSATSITFEMSFSEAQTVRTFEAKFGGFVGTAGTISLYIDDNETAEVSTTLEGTTEVLLKTASYFNATKIKITITGIQKGVKAYYIDYTYGEKEISEEVNTLKITHQLGLSYTRVLSEYRSYKIAATIDGTTYYLSNLSSTRFTITTSIDSALELYVEYTNDNTRSNFYLYSMEGDVKTYYSHPDNTKADCASSTTKEDDAKYLWYISYDGYITSAPCGRMLGSTSGGTIGAYTSASTGIYFYSFVGDLFTVEFSNVLITYQISSDKTVYDKFIAAYGEYLKVKFVVNNQEYIADIFNIGNTYYARFTITDIPEAKWDTHIEVNAYLVAYTDSTYKTVKVQSSVITENGAYSAKGIASIYLSDYAANENVRSIAYYLKEFVK